MQRNEKSPSWSQRCDQDGAFVEIVYGPWTAETRSGAVATRADGWDGNWVRSGRQSRTQGKAASNCASSLRSRTQFFSRRDWHQLCGLTFPANTPTDFLYSWRSVKVVITTTAATIAITPYEYRRDGSGVREELGILPEASGRSVRESVFVVRDIGCGAGPIPGAIPKGGDHSLRNICTELS